MSDADDTRYNGWNNRETWNTNLWIGNEPWSDEESRRIVASHIEDDEPGDYEDDVELDRSVRVRNAADELASWWTDSHDPEELGGTALPGPIADAWAAALGATDWYEIAEGIAEDMTTPAQDAAR